MCFKSFFQSNNQSRCVTSVESRRRLKLLQRTADSMVNFTSWPDVRSWLDAVGLRNHCTDPVLRPVLGALKSQPDEVWHDIALFLFWNSLFQYRRALEVLDKHPASLDSQIGWALLRVLHRIDLGKRETGLGKKILNDVQHDVRAHYSAEYKLASLAAELYDERDDDDFEQASPLTYVCGYNDPAFNQVEYRHDYTRWRATLKNLVRIGRLSKPAYLILIGQEIYDRSLRDMSERLGLSYEATKKHNQRGKKYLKNIKNICPRTRIGTPSKE